MEPLNNEAISSTAKAEANDDLLGIGKSPPSEDMMESPEDKLFREDSQILMNQVPEEVLNY